MTVYLVTTERFGVVRKAADNIEHAREWAKKALGAGPRQVTREPTDRPLCRHCDSRPCCCRKET